MGLQTIKCVQESASNALAVNKDATQVATAGRNVFKIYSIGDDEFVEKVNLRVGKNLNLNFSCSDVAWNPVDDHVLATAATNGAVVTWNLNKTSRSKQDVVFQDHKRTVNKVNFHPTESHLLISGSQDGTMKLFDLRRHESVATFDSNSESVRDVQFNPFQSSMFSAVHENGYVQLWDLRRADRHEREFTAHSGPIFTCDWHPEHKNWIATGGRDKTIKIWDVTSKATLEHNIYTIASVARVKWRPQRKHHIASCSLVMDFSINVWDIRRPYIPFAAFNDHKDVTTGIAWRADPHVLLSTSKDSTLYQHGFADAVRPTEKASPLALELSITGDVAFAGHEKLLSEGLAGRGSMSGMSGRLPAFFRKQANSNSDEFDATTSCFFVFQNTEETYGKFDPTMRWFTQLASEYCLSGGTFTDMCTLNSEVARSHGRLEISSVWSMLSVMYGGEHLNATAPNSNHKSLEDEKVEAGAAALGDVNTPHLGGSGSASHRDRHVSGTLSILGGVSDRHDLSTTTGLSEDDNNTETDETDPEKNISRALRGDCFLPTSFFLPEGDTDGLCDGPGFDYGLGGIMGAAGPPSDWTLPPEAFSVRYELSEVTHSPPSAVASRDVLQSLGDFGGDVGHHNSMCGINSGAERVGRENGRGGSFSLAPEMEVMPEALHVPAFDYKPLTAEMLQEYAEQGDVQTAASMLIVLGDHMNGYVDLQTQEQWLLSYIDLLSRFQLWTTANQIIKQSKVPSVLSLSQQSTTVHTNCNQCMRPLARVGWLCDRCHALTNTCSVCHQVVKGLYVWCQGCSHGGHLTHMQNWLKKSEWCPTGCGHRCEYV